MGGGHETNIYKHGEKRTPWCARFCGSGKNGFIFPPWKLNFCCSGQALSSPGLVMSCTQMDELARFEGKCRRTAAEHIAQPGRSPARPHLLGVFYSGGARARVHSLAPEPSSAQSPVGAPGGQPCVLPLTECSISAEVAHVAPWWTGARLPRRLHPPGFLHQPRAVSLGLLPPLSVLQPIAPQRPKGDRLGLGKLRRANRKQKTK